MFLLYTTETHVFYSAGFSVESYDVSKRQLKRLAELDVRGPLAADEQFVYVAALAWKPGSRSEYARGGGSECDDTYAIYRIRRTGGLPVRVLTGLSRPPDALVALGSALWFIDDARCLRRLPFGSGASHVLDVGNPVGSIAADGTTLYVVDDAHRLLRIDSAEPSRATSIAEHVNMTAGEKLVFDEQHVYWVHRRPGASDVLRCMPKTGGAVASMLLANEGAILLAVREGHAYLQSRRDPAHCYRIPSSFGAQTGEPRSYRLPAVSAVTSHGAYAYLDTVGGAALVRFNL